MMTTSSLNCTGIPAVQIIVSYQQHEDMVTGKGKEPYLSTPHTTGHTTKRNGLRSKRRLIHSIGT